MTFDGWVGIAQALGANAVTVLGFFGKRWPLGTVLALYWAESVLTAVLLLARFIIWRIFLRDETNIEKASVQIRMSLGDFIAMAMAFNIGHGIALLIFIGLMLPKNAPAEAFDRQSFIEGVTLIAIVLAIGFVCWLLTMKRTDAIQLNRTLISYTQRIAVLHLTIIFGFLAFLVFGHAKAFFAVFSTMKIIADISSTIPAPKNHS